MNNRHWALRKPAAPGRRPAARPRVEELEARALLSASPAATPFVEGAAGTLAVPFTGTTPPAKVTIDWGDHHADTNQFTLLNGSLFLTHTYADEGAYDWTVTVTPAGPGTPKPAVMHGTAHVADAALSATGAPAGTALAGSRYTGLVASFTDANPGGTPKDFSVTVNWGDGSKPVRATEILPDASVKGLYHVFAGHTFQHAGPDVVTVVIKDKGGSQATVTSSVQVFAPAASLRLGAGPYAVGSPVPFTLQVTGTPGNLAPSTYGVQYQGADKAWHILAAGAWQGKANPQGAFVQQGGVTFTKKGTDKVRAFVLVGGEEILSPAVAVTVTAAAHG